MANNTHWGVLKGTHSKHYLTPTVCRVGRDAKANDVILLSQSISKKQCIIDATNINNTANSVVLTDLNSRNGTFINDGRIRNAAKSIYHGDIVRFGFDSNCYRLELANQPEIRAPVMQTKLDFDVQNNLAHRQDNSSSENVDTLDHPSSNHSNRHLNRESNNNAPPGSPAWKQLNRAPSLMRGISIGTGAGDDVTNQASKSSHKSNRPVVNTDPHNSTYVSVDSDQQNDMRTTINTFDSHKHAIATNHNMTSVSENNQNINNRKNHILSKTMSHDHTRSQPQLSSNTVPIHGCAQQRASFMQRQQIPPQKLNLHHTTPTTNNHNNIHNNIHSASTITHPNPSAQALNQGQTFQSQHYQQSLSRNPSCQTGDMFEMDAINAELKKLSQRETENNLEKFYDTVEKLSLDKSLNLLNMKIQYIVQLFKATVK